MSSEQDLNVLNHRQKDGKRVSVKWEDYYYPING